MQAVISYPNPRFLAEALANARPSVLSEQAVLGRHGLSAKTFESWKQNYAQQDLRQAFLALASHADPPTLSGVAAHQLLTLPSVLKSKSDAHLLVLLLERESKNLTPLIYGQLFAETVNAFCRVHHWILVTHLLNFFVQDQSAETKQLRRNIQVWEYLFIALSNTWRRDGWAVKHFYRSLAEAFCAYHMPDKDFEEFPTTNRPLRGARPVNISTFEAIFSRPDLIFDTLASTLLDFMKIANISISLPIRQAVLAIHVGKTTFSLTTWFTDLCEAAYEENGLKLFPDDRSDVSANLNSLITDVHLIYLKSLFTKKNFTEAYNWHLRIEQAIEQSVKTEVPLDQFRRVLLENAVHRPPAGRLADQIREIGRTSHYSSKESRMHRYDLLLAARVRTKAWKEVVRLWDHQVAGDSQFVPTLKNLGYIATALVHLDLWDEAIAVVTWYGKPAASFSNYTLEKKSPIPALWPNRPPIHCSLRQGRHSISLDSAIINLLLNDLVHLERWQDFYSFWKLLESAQLYAGYQLNDQSLSLFLRAGLLASGKSGRGGDRVEHIVGRSKLTGDQQQGDVWDGIVAWKRACALFESQLLAAYPQFAEGVNRVEDPIKSAHGIAGIFRQGKEWLNGPDETRDSKEEVNTPTCSSLSWLQLTRHKTEEESISLIPNVAAFQEYIYLIGLFSRSERLPHTLAWMKAIEETGAFEVDSPEISSALVLYEESGPSTPEVRALESWTRTAFPKRYAKPSHLSGFAKALSRGTMFENAWRLKKMR